MCTQVCIRAEHSIGLLKGRFQALRELRVQIHSHRRHLWTITLIRCCLILHNLILRIEDTDFDPEFREELFTAGQQPWQDEGGSDDDGSDIAPDLQVARRALETDGQRFRKSIMRKLFDSPDSGAVHRPDGASSRREAGRGQRGHRGVRGRTHGRGRGRGHGRGARRCI